jgi:tetratricopeptide (TPR) repeat protein
MAKKKEFKKEDEQLENVNEALSTTGQWIEDHANLLSWIVLAIAAVVLGIIAINNYVIKPKALEASNENAKAQAYFLRGDFEKALHGDDAECLGFEQIANDYRLYQQGELAALYAGICYYELGEYEDAAKYVKRFSAKDVNIDPAAHQFLGHAGAEDLGPFEAQDRIDRRGLVEFLHQFPRRLPRFAQAVLGIGHVEIVVHMTASRGKMPLGNTQRNAVRLFSQMRC